MKALILALSLLPLTTFARVGNDGPSGAPPQAPRPQASALAEVTTACGFMCPKADVHGLRILVDGTVVQYSYNRETPEKDVIVARLAAGTLSKLKTEAEKITGGELVDESEGQPECMDAPTTTYQVRAKDGAMIKIAQNYGCHDHVLPNGEGGSILEVLKGLSALPR